jgi:serine/threonine-protein kinase
MKVTLHLTEGPEAGKVFEFDQADTFLVGRTPKAHLRFSREADRHISRTHFLLDIRPPRCFITDLGSTNGTFVNNKRIQRADLADGDVIRVGRTSIEVHIEGPEAEAESTLPCSVCGRNVQPPPGLDEGEAPLCEVCRQRKDASAAPSAAPSPPTRIDFTCMNCGADVSEQAGRDPLNHTLHMHLFLCESCAESARADNQIKTHIGDYAVVGVLGEGGMGVVYKVVYPATRRVLAIKMILPELVQSEYASKVFEREVAVQSKVVHPNLVRVLDHGVHHKAPYFVTEYLAGGDVKNLVVWEFQGPLDPALACRVAIQILTGLEALHSNGFIHRDLKPANFLLDRPHTNDDFLVKIADYGLAKSFETAGHSMFDYTREGIAAGSYVFIPPEQITNYKFVKPPVDIYAVGASLYFMLSAKHSVDFPTPSEDTSGSAGPGYRHPIQIVLEDPPVPLGERRPDLPESLTQAVDKAVVKDVKHRYKTSTEFRKALELVASKQNWPFP